MRSIITLLFFVIFFSAPAYAADAVYRVARMQAGYPWHAGLAISFDANEDLCKKHYGSRWQAKCAAPLGRPGATAAGIKLAPPAEGHWQWQSPSTLAFLPANSASLKPDTTYKADLAGLGLPAFVSLNTTEPQCQTLPQAAQLIESRFWTDPSPHGAHRLAMSLDFSFPVSGQHFVFSLAAPAGAQFGKPELVWNHDRDHLNISWPVRKLPASAAPATLHIQSMRQIFMSEGQPRLAPPTRRRCLCPKYPLHCRNLSRQKHETCAGIHLWPRPPLYPRH